MLIGCKKMVFNCLLFGILVILNKMAQRLYAASLRGYGVLKLSYPITTHARKCVYKPSKKCLFRHRRISANASQFSFCGFILAMGLGKLIFMCLSYFKNTVKRCLKHGQ